jgi:hypothetical protein
VAEARALSPDLHRPQLVSALRRIKEKYRLTDLTATPNHGKLTIHAAVNPEYEFELPDIDGLNEELVQALDAAKLRIDGLGPLRSTSPAQAILIEEVQRAAPNARLQFTPTPSTQPGPQGVSVTIYAPRPRFLGMIVNIYSTIWTKIGQRGSQQLFTNAVNGLQYVLSSTGSKVPRVVHRNINTTEQQILDRTRFNTPAGETIVYRDLPSRPGRGARRNDPVTNDPRQHVLNADLPSAFTSVTTLPLSSASAMTNPRGTGQAFNTSGTIDIDLFQIDPNRILDLTSPTELAKLGFFSGRVDARGAADAVRTKEVLIRGGIPGVAISNYVPRN